MKTTVLLAVFLASGALMTAQPPVPDFATVNDTKAWTIFNATAESAVIDGRNALRLKAAGDSANRIAGLVMPAGTGFGTGVIELDLKGKDVKQGSFLGVAFNIRDERTFEAVYFRPFNFRADEPVRRRAVQYIAWPENTWQKLRQEHPGEFENRVQPVPDPNDWFHVRVEIGEKQVRVFVNGAAEPCLSVNRLVAKAGSPAPLGLFVDVAEGCYANLRITPAAP